MALTLPPVRGVGDLGHVSDSNLVRAALAELDARTASADGGVAGLVKWDDTVGRRLLVRRPNGAWQMVYGDTGWRTLTLENGWTGTTVLLRRLGFLVHLSLVDLVATGATSQVLWTPPTGFAAYSNFRYSVNANPAIPAFRIVSATSGVSIPEYQTMTGTPSAYLAWSTNAPWPTALPGAASGTLPLAAPPPDGAAVQRFPVDPEDYDPIIPTGLTAAQQEEWTPHAG